MNIGIIGCGWLGKSLAKHLNKQHNLICFSRKNTKDIFWENKLFIISISTKESYLQSLQGFLSKIPSDAVIIFTSSSSVYKGYDTEVTEESIIRQSTLQRQAEELLLASHKNVLILRLGGLMGDDRIAGKWKGVASFTDGPVNYIHKDDVIHIISELIAKNILKGIFNLIAPQHPLRSEVHKKNSQDFGFELGSFEEVHQRVVNADKIIKTLEYTFIHPNPLTFWT